MKTKKHFLLTNSFTSAVARASRNQIYFQYWRHFSGTNFYIFLHSHIFNFGLNFKFSNNSPNYRSSLKTNLISSKINRNPNFLEVWTILTLQLDGTLPSQEAYPHPFPNYRANQLLHRLKALKTSQVHYFVLKR